MIEVSKQSTIVLEGKMTNFVDRIVAIGVNIAISGDHPDKTLIEKRTRLWANATDEDLEAYARHVTEDLGGTFSENLERAREIRERFRKQLAS